MSLLHEVCQLLPASDQATFDRIAASVVVEGRRFCSPFTKVMSSELQEFHPILMMLRCCIVFKEESYLKRVSCLSNALCIYNNVVVSYTSHQVPSHHFKHGPSPLLRGQRFSSGTSLLHNMLAYIKYMLIQIWMCSPQETFQMYQTLPCNHHIHPHHMMKSLPVLHKVIWKHKALNQCYKRLT